MPGAETPAAVRVDRYKEGLSQHLMQSAAGQSLVPCLAHGDFVSVESLQADHVQAKKEIIRRQIDLVDKLNQDAAFAEFMMQQSGMDKFFVQVGKQYYGTIFYYELYFNDIDNIWLICEACNLQKSDHESVDWFHQNWLYGPEFLDYLARLGERNTIILRKIENKGGLAQVAIDWFWERHAHYLSVMETFHRAVKKPIDILSMKIDHVVGFGNRTRAERLQSSLDFRFGLLGAIASASGLAMPRGAGESPHSSSDSDERMGSVEDSTGHKVALTQQEYLDAASAVQAWIPGAARDRLKAEASEAVKKRRREDAQEDDEPAKDTGEDHGSDDEESPGLTH